METQRASNTLAAEANGARVLTYRGENSKATLPDLECVAEYDHWQTPEHLSLTDILRELRTNQRDMDLHQPQVTV